VPRRLGSGSNWPPVRAVALERVASRGLRPELAQEAPEAAEAAESGKNTRGWGRGRGVGRLWRTLRAAGALAGLGRRVGPLTSTDAFGAGRSPAGRCADLEFSWSGDDGTMAPR